MNTKINTRTAKDRQRETTNSFVRGYTLLTLPYEASITHGTNFEETTIKRKLVRGDPLRELTNDMLERVEIRSASFVTLIQFA